MFDKKRVLRHSVFVLLVGVVALGSVAVRAAEGRKHPAQAADKAKDIDWKKAKELWDRSRSGGHLTADEQAYLERAKQQRQPQGGGAPGGTASKGGSSGRNVVGRILDYDPMPLPHVQLPAGHPRLWFSAKDLPEFRRRCQSTHKGYFDAIVDRGIQEGGQPGIRPFNLAFLYQMTDEAKYARQAIELARDVKPFRWVHPDGQSLPYGEWYAGLADRLDALAGKVRKLAFHVDRQMSPCVLAGKAVIETFEKTGKHWSQSAKLLHVHALASLIRQETSFANLPKQGKVNLAL